MLKPGKNAQLLLTTATMSLLCFILSPGNTQTANQQAGEAFFEKQVRPILSARCYACHSASTKSPGGGVRLDVKAAVIGKSVIPGDPDHSSLEKAIEYQDPNLKMPPSGKLSAQEIATIRTWIKMGANWPASSAKPLSVQDNSKFWAFQPLKPVTLKVGPKAQASPIDQFVQQMRAAKKLAPAPRADRRTLIRRATFDLTGLPPTPQEVRDFCADKRPDAYSLLLDRLMASPAYGEKWGRHWLDVARYADSNGVDENLVYTNAYRYRDYVIRAFNQDKPINRFIQEQIAGDLLPPASNDAQKLDQIVATGFLSLGPKMLAEDDPVKQEEDIIDEQVDTVGKAFLGLTLGCARCHDHKFDPIPQKDYYALAGIFKSTKTMLNFRNMAEWQEVPLGTPENQQKLKEIQDKRAPLKSSSEEIRKNAIAAVLKTAEGRLSDYRNAAKQLIALPVGSLPNAKLKASEVTAPAGSTLIEAEDYLAGNVIKDTDGFGKGIGVLVNRGEYPNFAEYNFSVTGTANTAVQLDLRYASGDKRACRLYINGILVTSNAAGGVTGGFYPDAQKWECAGVFKLAPGVNKIRIERDSYFPHIDKLLISKASMAAVHPTLETIAAEAGLNAELLKQAMDQLRDPVKQQRIQFEEPDNAEALLTQDQRKQIQAIKDKIADLEKQKPPMPRAMAVTDGKPTDLKVHLRGSYLTLGQDAPRGFPAVLTTSKTVKPSPLQSGRLELANWLTAPENPLTARVFVNRVWRWHFGAGIVGTTDNFGKLGDRPTNPALLDWLASDFRKQGWSLKKLHKTIMQSETYMSSAVTDPKSTAHGLAADPENKTLWRFPRRRLEAEEIRDSMLFVSGQLDTTLGGSLLKFRDREYVTSTANSDPVNYTSNRRSCYLPVVRSALYDVYTAFDFGDPTVMNGDRATTTVAPQALFMMNSPLALTQSRILAENLLKQTSLSDAARVQSAYQICLARSASAKEIKRALGFVEAITRTYAADDMLKNKPDEAKLKAWQSLCKAVIASNEFIYID